MSELYFGGVPVEPDVKKLLKVYPTLNVGDVIRHSEIEEHLGVKYRSSRYRTVTDAWRKRMFCDQNILLGAVSGVGFKVLSPDERLDRVSGRFRAASRQDVRAKVEHSAIDTDQCDEIGKKRHEIQGRFLDAALDTRRRQYAEFKSRNRLLQAGKALPRENRG